MDLIDLSPYSSSNENMKFLLTFIDIFSHFAYVKPLKSKSQNDVLKAVKSFITDRNRPDRIRSDLGAAFKGKKLSQFFKSKI